MANIGTYIAAIESASRGEEVRDSITAALNAMNMQINAIQVEVDSLVEDPDAEY